ncbi:hypothetical protein [Roseibium salinum]|uniref:Minor tail protein n=1 Tax=Roseibium salinum TaxID=1604349 RepID=A0ABT3R079_9HYPH|nr:hypothetical protein [Roseibium sp. DSM 29163]MCX2722616.1 hypothetical protein [Roseibium sp. DSM 29163]
MPTDAVTVHNQIPKPDEANTLQYDMGRLKLAMDLIDTLIFALNGELAAKAASVHGHAITDVTGLQNELDQLSQQIASKPGTLAGLSDTNTADVTHGMVLQYLTGAWQAVAAKASFFAVDPISGLTANNVQDAIAELKGNIVSILGAAPETLDTLNELAAALGDDPNFAATVTTQLGQKANSADLGAHATQAPEPARQTLGVEVQTRVTGDTPEFYDPSSATWKKFGSGGGAPVGSVMPWFSDTPPSDLWLIIKDQNQVFSRALFPQLFDVLAPERTVVFTNGSAVVTGIGSDNGFAPGIPVEGAGIPAGATIQSVDGPSQVTLSAAATADGTTCRVFRYGNGDGSTTAGLPNLAGRYMRGWDPSALINVDAGGALGITQEHAIENITGEVGYRIENDTTALGAFYRDDSNKWHYTNSSGDGASDGAAFDASRVVNTSESETRGKEVVGTWIIKVADGVDDPAILNANDVVQDVAQNTADIAQNTSDIAALQSSALTYVELETTSYTWGVWYTMAHGLGKRPKTVQLFAECTVATSGYAVGERALLGTVDRSNNDGSAYNYGIGLSYDETSVHWASGSQAMRITPRNSGGTMAPSSSNFKIVAVVGA